MKRRVLRTRLPAVMTVEAAFVMPLVFFAILALLFLCFYEHNRVKLKAELITECELVRTRSAELKRLPDVNEINTIVKENERSGYLWGTADIIATENDKGEVILRASLNMNFASAGVFTYLIRSFTAYETVGNIKYEDREKILRYIACGKEIWDKAVK